MKHCELLEGCSFLNGLEEELSVFFQTLYCLEDFSGCARYEASLYLGRGKVPEHIFPNEKDFISLFPNYCTSLSC